MLRLLDRYALAVETKGGHVSFTSKRVVFTSNTRPEEWYPNVPHRPALSRRLGSVFEFPGQAAIAKMYLKALVAKDNETESEEQFAVAVDDALTSAGF